MKHLIFLLLITIGCIPVKSQDTIWVRQVELNRLISQIREHPKPDSNRVHILSEYGNLCFYDLDFLNGFKAITELRTISKELNYTKGEGLYLKSISNFRQRISEALAFINNHDSTREIFGTESIEYLDIYYETAGNRILGKYTDFSVFGNINIPLGGRDSEIEEIKSNLEKALRFYSTKEYLSITAYLHEALSSIYFKSDAEKSKDHKKIAQRLYHQLKLSYHQLLILIHDIDYLLSQGSEDKVRPLEIEAINIYTKEQDSYIKAHCAFLLARTYGMHNRANLQLEYLFQAEDLLTGINEKDLLKSIYLLAASVYEWYFTNPEKALEYEYKELNLREETGFYESVAYTYLLISESLFGLNRIKDFPAEYKDYLKIGGIKGSQFFDAELLWIKARMLEAQGKKEALSIYLESIATYMKYNDRNGASWAALDLAEAYHSFGNLQKAIQYAQISFDWASEINLLNRKVPASDLLSQLYEQAAQKEKAYFYLKQYKLSKDQNDILNDAASRSELEMQSILNQRQREIEQLEAERKFKEQENRTQRIWLISVAGALASLLILSFILIRNNRQKQKTNRVLEATLRNLKSTQAQLIQSEKMASLGELTAGIAHEIQNPLNFVNNFSEVNRELIDELKIELKKGNYQEVEDISTDIKTNEEKINLHGKRADAIVKSMLQHSQISSGEKELVDINACCDEYIRLAYHGMVARDKTFNVDIKTGFDPELPKIKIVPQDIGRVILNILNNAFQACTEQNRRASADRSLSSVSTLSAEGEKDGNVLKKPTVTVTTKKLDNVIEIAISDNGPGVPDEIRDKIFQPFFTTKPTGQGTGLGLSLSYDIVKAHGGTLEMETKPGVGTTMKISLLSDQHGDKY